MQPLLLIAAAAAAFAGVLLHLRHYRCCFFNPTEQRSSCIAASSDSTRTCFKSSPALIVISAATSKGGAVVASPPLPLALHQSVVLDLTYCTFICSTADNDATLRNLTLHVASPPQNRLFQGSAHIALPPPPPPSFDVLPYIRLCACCSAKPL